MKKISNISKAALRILFKALRKYSNEENKYWMQRYADEITGYIKALMWEGKISEKQYDDIRDIVTDWSIYGKCRPLKVRKAA